MHFFINRDTLRKHKLILSITLLNILSYYFCLAQTNTVGVISSPFPTEGYNLLYPHNQSSIYLLNNCGEIVKEWENEPTTRPGNIVYLLENGNLVIAKKDLADSTYTFGAGGAGGIIEWKNWENESLAKFSFIDENVRAHHDIEPLPNGNVLAIVWEKKTSAVILQAGIDTTLHDLGELWPDAILELDPLTEEIVWEWHAWDHLIQEYDNTKSNYGDVSSHPELIHLNFDISEDVLIRPDWMHTNSISYNEDLDQILISVPNFNEIWIIDHSTTTLEAAGHSGGNSKKGGDLLFRYGNPKAYKKENFSDQKCFFQHDAKWIDVDQNSKYHGMISYFNNRVDNAISQVNIIKPYYEDDNKNYKMEDNEFIITTENYTLKHPSKTIFSSGLSSAQVLWNNNILVLSGREGYAFELNDENEIVWEYEIPLDNGVPVEQGATDINNVAFRIAKYPTSFSAFEDRELSPKGFIELSPNTNYCRTSTEDSPAISINIFPNPTTSGFVNFHLDRELEGPVYLYNAMGVISRTFRAKNQNHKIYIGDLETGLYFFASRRLVLGKVLLLDK